VAAAAAVAGGLMDERTSRRADWMSANFVQQVSTTVLLHSF